MNFLDKQAFELAGDLIEEHAFQMSLIHEQYPDKGKKEERERNRKLREPLLDPLRAECIRYHYLRIKLNIKALEETRRAKERGQGHVLSE